MYRKVQQLIKPHFLPKSVKYHPPNNIPDQWIFDQVVTSRGKIATRYWLHPENPGHKTVLLVHPYDIQAKDFYLRSGHPEMYHKMGFHVLIFDFNGFGESENTDLHFEKDILEIAQHYYKIWKINQMVIHGISFGAAMTILAMKQPHPFHRAIIEGSLDKMPHYFKARKIKLYYLIKILHTLIPSLENTNSYDFQIQYIRDLKKILFIYTTEDDLTTISMGKKLIGNCPVAADLVILKGDHMEAITEDPILYREAIFNYINVKD